MSLYLEHNNLPFGAQSQELMVSLYQDIDDITHQTKIDVPLIEIARLIQTEHPEATELVNQEFVYGVARRLGDIRRYRDALINEGTFNKNDPEWKRRKRTSPHISVYVTFTLRRDANNGATRETGFIVLDIDKASDLGILDRDGDPMSINRMRQIINDDPHTLMSFVSSSNDGIKVFVKVWPYESGVNIRKPELLKRDYIRPAVDAVAQYYADLLGVPRENRGGNRLIHGLADAACVDSARICYLWHDPDVHYNEASVPIMWSKTNEHKEVFKMLNMVDMEDYQIWRRNIRIIADDLMVEDHLKLLMCHIISAKHPEKYDADPSKVDSEFADSDYPEDQRAHIGSIIHDAVQEGYTRLGNAPSLETISMPVPDRPIYTREYGAKLLEHKGIKVRMSSRAHTLEIHLESSIPEIDIAHRNSVHLAAYPEPWDSQWMFINDSILKAVTDILNEMLYDIRQFLRSAGRQDLVHGWQFSEWQAFDSMAKLAGDITNAEETWLAHLNESLDDNDSFEKAIDDLMLTLGVEYEPGTSNWTIARKAGMQYFASMADRMVHPGCEVRLTLILRGPQAVGKTRFGWFWVPNHRLYHASMTRNVRDSFEFAGRASLVELAETVMISQRIDEVKAEMTQTMEHRRLPWEKISGDYPRAFVYIGTMNTTRYLPADRSGNTRFFVWPLRAQGQAPGFIDSIPPIRDRVMGFAYRAILEHGTSFFMEDDHDYHIGMQRLNARFMREFKLAATCLRRYLDNGPGASELTNISIEELASRVYGYRYTDEDDAPDFNEFRSATRIANRWTGLDDIENAYTDDDRDKMIDELKFELVKRGWAYESREVGIYNDVQDIWLMP